jgi:chromosome segregation ATPase
MSNLVGCDYTCQRKKNIERLRDLYETELNNYYNTYNSYLKYKYDNSRDAGWKRNYAATKLRPRVVEINRNLNRMLRELKNNIRYTDQQIDRQKRILGSKTNTIHQKNKVIHTQDELVEDKNNELLSKERQVEFSKERNSYRRIMLFVLLIVNIILAGLFYYLIMKN